MIKVKGALRPFRSFTCKNNKLLFIKINISSKKEYKIKKISKVLENHTFICNNNTQIKKNKKK